MVNSGTGDTVTEMSPSISDVKEDEKATTESEPASVPTEETKTKSTDDDKKQKNVGKAAPSTASDETIITESSKKKKKKKKDTPSSEQKVTKDSSTSSPLTKSDTEKEEGKENGTTVNKIVPKENEDGKEKDAVVAKKEVKNDLSSGPVVSATKRTRPPYKYDPEKITLRFLFANRDGLTVTIECKPGDSVGEVKGQLLSVWPKDLDECSGGDHLRLICMGKGVLMPDVRTLQDCEVPVFKTHPTPVNVAVRPKTAAVVTPNKSGKKDGGSRGGSSSGGGSSNRTTEETRQGCGCVIS